MNPPPPDPARVRMQNAELEPREIDEIFVAVATDGRREGVCVMQSAFGAMPVVFTRRELIAQFDPHLQRLARETGRAVELRRYSMQETFQRFEA